MLLPFRRLRWQLTLTYILITLVAALTLEVTTTVASVLAPPKTPTAPPADILVNAMRFTEAPQIVPYLEQSPPDEHGLATWANLWTPQFTFSKLGFAGSRTGAAQSSSPLPIDSASNVTVAIVDPEGHLLASASTSASPVATLLASPVAQAALHKALQPAKPSPKGVLTDGRTIAVVAVAANDNGPVLGALLVAAKLAPGPQPPAVGPFQLDQIAGALQNTLPSALALVLLASVLGTLSGLLTSRRITRRLGRMTQAADAWRQGELDVSVGDDAPDELGRLAQNLNSMAGQLRRLLAERQALAVAEERHRLARDLHDSVKQRLFAVTLLVGSARLDVQERPDTEHTLRDAEQIARQAQQELTALIQALRPSALAGKGLSTAVQELCRDWSQRTGIPTSVQAPRDLTLPPKVDQELFRVVEEALSNVARHSGADQVWVSLAQGQDVVVLRIEDNGHGFDVDAVGSGGRADSMDGTDQEGRGLGLRSMRERIEALSGAFHIASGAGGTRVEARVTSVPQHEPTEELRAPVLLPAANRPEPAPMEATNAANHRPADRR
jgi:NarL family two-component system sensor histidine kinase LiaS